MRKNLNVKKKMNNISIGNVKPQFKLFDMFEPKS